MTFSRLSPWCLLAMPLLLAACAQAPVEPSQPAAAPSSAAPAISATTADAIARYRRSAEAARQAGDLATAAAQWQVVSLLAPGDEQAKRELAATHAAIAKETRDQLAAGIAAMAAGDIERATQAMLRVLALEPSQPDAAKALRAIDRRRFTRIQADRAAKVSLQDQVASRGSARAPMANGDGGDGFDVEQAIEMFRAGDSAGGLRDLKAYVDANPGNRAVRVRVASVVAERAREVEDKGAREEALGLYEQASALRGDQGGPWVARMGPLRKTLSQEYFDKGSRAFRTNLPQAITLLEASVRYDPNNAQAAAKLKDAKAARDKLNSIK
jgi:tetratricopeptide (TPR) repeat protein